jgi:uncharacterized protein YkwD
MAGWSFLVDGIIVLVIAFGGWRGWRDGLLASMANLIGLAISLILAFLWYDSVSHWVLLIWSVPVSLANVLAFLLLAIVIDGIVSMVVLLAGRRFTPKGDQARWWRLAGVLPGGLTAAAMAAYAASLLLSLPLDHPIKVAVRESWLGPMMAREVAKVGTPVDQSVQPALNDISQIFTIEPESKEFVTLPFKVHDPVACADLERGMLDLVNKERNDRGIGSVRIDEPLRDVGRSHSLDMFQRGYFSHYTPEGKDPFDRMNEAGIEYQAAGENLALAPTLSAAHTGLMNSPGHKRNILDSNFHKLGIGCYKSDRYGLMFSQEFSN